MNKTEELVTLNLADDPIWERCFFVHPLIIIGTTEEEGGPNFAPKHMATPIGFDNWFCFVCTPYHRTYQNALREGCFTVSYPPPDQVLLASFAASPRDEVGGKPNMEAIPTLPAKSVKGFLVDDCPFYLECKTSRTVDGFGEYALVIGKVVAAHAKPSILRDADKDDGDLIENNPLLAYLAPGRFAAIDRSQGFPFPKGFQR